MAYTGMCRWTGYGFSVCPKQGVYFVICFKEGPKMKDVDLNRVGVLRYFRPFFVLNSVRVSNRQRYPIPKHGSSAPPGGGCVRRYVFR